MNEKVFQEQKARARRLLGRKGWTLHLKAYPHERLYAAAAKRDVDGKWHGAYIGRVEQLGKMSDEAILGKLPDVA